MFDIVQITQSSQHFNIHKKGLYIYIYVYICIYMTIVSFISYSLPYYDLSQKGDLIILRIQKNIVINDFMYTLKFDNSPCGEIST